MEVDTKASGLFQDKGAARENIGWSSNGRRAKDAARKKLIGHKNSELQAAVTVSS